MSKYKKGYKVDYLKEFILKIQNLDKAKHSRSIFKDFLILSTCTIAQPFYRSDKIEQKYLSTVSTYNKEQANEFSQMLALLVNALEEKYQDFLGQVYMQLNIGNIKTGQFFTPYSISKMMAQINWTESIEKLKQNKLLTLSEPCCGSGGMAIAFAETMKEQGHNYQNQLFVEAIDIDELCFMMTYIQLSLFGIPARVLLGDALAWNIQRVLYTPLYFVNGFDWKLRQIQDKILASVDNKFGIIDMYNNIIIPFEYENLEQCYSKDDLSLFFAYKNGKCGIVDISNNIIFPFKYEWLYSFGEKTFIAKQKHEAYVIVDEHDNLVCSTVFEAINPCSFGKNEDLYPAQLNGYYGFIDEFGNKKVDFKYAYIRPSRSKYAMVSRTGDESCNDRYGVIDEAENLILPFEYEYGINSILKNRFIVRKYGKQGIVNEKNQKITELIFDHIDSWNYICIDCDVDEQKAYNGLKTLEEKEKELGKLPTTLTQTTPRGGKHFIFSSKGIINAIGKIGKDIDVKFNGYILISPSIINGKRYVITDGINDDGNFVIADLPQVWLDYINKTNCKGGKAVSKHTDTFESKPKVYKNIDVDKMFNSCAFLKFCKDNAEDLSEPMWHSMITVLAQIEGSDELIHTLSEPYHNYSFEETQKKIDNARQFGYPQSCKYLSDNYPDVCKNCNSNFNSSEVDYD